MESDDTKVDSSFVIDTVVDVSLKSSSIVGEGVFFLLPMTEKDAPFRYRKKLECSVYTHFVVIVRIELWKVWIIFIGLQRRW